MSAAQTTSVLTTMIEKARTNDKMALIPFVTAGFPDQHSFWLVLESLVSSGAHVIEIGVPFSDPVADGPVVAAASAASVEEGISLQWIFDGLRQRKDSYTQVGIVLMSYANPLLHYGWKRTDSAVSTPMKIEESLKLLARDMAHSGVHGVIIPDLPYEEASLWRVALAEQGVDLIPLVGPNTSVERMKLYAAGARGYVYVTSVTGITGIRKELPPEAAAAIAQAHEVFQLPVALGFGIHHPQQLDGLSVASRPDAVIFGSALLEHIRLGKPVDDFMRLWRAS